MAFSQFQQKPMLGEQLDLAHHLSDFTAAWFFLEGSGLKVFDLSGNGNTGTINGSGVYWLNVGSTHLDSSSGAGDNGHLLTEALDGTDYWERDAGEVHWFIIDLGQTYTVTKVKGRSESAEDPTDINIYVSDDKGDFGAAVGSGIATWQDTEAWVVTDTTDKAGRYVKVEIDATEQGTPGTLQFGTDPRYPMFDVGVDVPCQNWVPGKFGSALDFDGADDYVNWDSASNEWLTNTQGTFATWIKLIDYGSVYQRLFSKTSSSVAGGWHNVLYLRINDDDKVLNWQVFNAAAANVLSLETTNSIVPNTWTHIILTVDTTLGTKIYINGVEETLIAGAGSASDHLWFNDIASTNKETILGGLRGNEGDPVITFFAGQIDHAMIYNHALSASEVTELYMNPFCMFADDNIALVEASIPAVGGQVIIIAQISIFLLPIFFVVRAMK